MEQTIYCRKIIWGLHKVSKKKNSNQNLIKQEESNYESELDKMEPQCLAFKNHLVLIEQQDLELFVE